jgi:hypothetical protein
MKTLGSTILLFHPLSYLKPDSMYVNHSTPKTVDSRVTTAEGAFTYHKVRNSLSFSISVGTSSDWFIYTSFSKSRVVKKISTWRTKTLKIITTVLGLLSDLEMQPFSIYIDAFNHKQNKLFPHVNRFNNAQMSFLVQLLNMKSQLESP